MKPATQKALPCSVFGHNYIKSKTNSDNTAELTCTHCNISVQTDVKGDFEISSISNRHIQSALRQLFHLNLGISKSLLRS
jgi:hypothetical protein